jgi:recombination protein RecA
MRLTVLSFTFTIAYVREKKANLPLDMSSVASLRASIEAQIPSAFTVYRRPEQKAIPTGISQIDSVTAGVPIGALTEICGSGLASSGKTSVLISLLAQATQKHFCALVDAEDSFDPASARVAGVKFSRLLWMRCGKQKTKLKPMEQAFKTADMLLQSGGFGLVVVDLSSLAEPLVRKVPLTTWFRFSRVVEKQRTALVFLEQQPHAASCAGLVLKLRSQPAAWSDKLLAQFRLEAEIMRTREKRPVQASFSRPNFSLRAEWA